MTAENKEDEKKYANRSSLRAGKRNYFSAFWQNDCGSDHAITGRNVGKTCRTHYRGTFNAGTQFDSSYDRVEPLEFVCGAGLLIK